MIITINTKIHEIFSHSVFQKPLYEHTLQIYHVCVYVQVFECYIRVCVCMYVCVGYNSMCACVGYNNVIQISN